MLKTLLRLAKAKIADTPEGDDKLYVRTAAELLGSEPRQVMLKKIKRLFSVTDDVWVKHYLYAIEQFAELVQELPASEYHHHSEKGGLLDHTLESIYDGMRVAQGYVLPPNTEPEEISSGTDRWRFGAFIATLGHDIGKVVTDIEVVYSVDKGAYQKWHPWYEALPVGAEYQFRYRPKAKSSKSSKSLHEKATMSMLPRLLTKEATQWLFQDQALLSQVFSTLTHSSFGGHVIAEIVRAADSASVSKNLGASTGTNNEHSTTTPLHQKLIVSLRKLINDGELKKNKPGAAIWVTDTDTWAVSKTVMEAVRAQLINEGHRGIPKAITRLFDELNSHQLLVSNQEGESVWYAQVHDYVRNWEQQLSFLRFKNEVIWPTSSPELFEGEVIAVDKQGNPLEGEGGAPSSNDQQPSTASDKQQTPGAKTRESTQDNKPFRYRDSARAQTAPQYQATSQESAPMPQEQVPLEAYADQADCAQVPSKTTKSKPKKPAKPTQLDEVPNIDDTAGYLPFNVSTENAGRGVKIPVADETEQLPSGSPEPASTNGEPIEQGTSASALHEEGLVSSAEAKQNWKYSRKVQEKFLIENDFIAWLVFGINKRRIRVNEPKAPVHILEHHVALVTPAIFNLYLEKNSLKKQIYEKRAGEKKAYTTLQKELESLDIHQRGSNGQNILRMKVEGSRSSSELRVYLLNRDCFPSLAKFGANKSMSIRI